MSSAHVMHDLEVLAFIWVGVLLCNILAHKTGLTNILYHIVFGSICVNAGLLPEEASYFLATYSELAIIIIMFALGLEEDVGNFMVGIKKAWGIALIGAAGPFVTGYVCTYLYFNDTKMAVMSGLCLTATAVSLSMMTLKSYGMSKSKASLGIMTSAVLDDIGSLALVAIIVPLLTSEEAVSAWKICLICLKAVAFFSIVIVVCKFVFPERVRLNWCCMSENHWYKWGLRHLMRTDPHQSTLLVLLVGLGFGLLAHVLGFHPGIGAYMGGLILKKGYFLDYFDKECPENDLTSPGSKPKTPEEMQLAARAAAARELRLGDADGFAAVSHAIDNIAMSWMGPVFFVLLGTKLVIKPDVLGTMVEEILILYVFMVINQFFSASIAARYVPGGFNFVESVMIGFGMLGRAELAFVVLNIAYVENKIMSQECFYVLMITCFLLNVTVPLVIGWWRPYYLGEKTLPYFMDEPQIGGMGADTGDADIHAGAGSPQLGSLDMSDVAISIAGGAPDSPQLPVHHFKFTMAANGTLLAATDQAVRFWGHRHELDVVGSKRVNGGFDCDPTIKGLPNLKDKADEAAWPSSNTRVLEVDATGVKGARKFSATVRRLKVEGSVFQDNMTMRNEKWVFNLSLHDLLSACPTTPSALKPAHACIVEMEELTLEKDGTYDWRETARFRKGYEEDVQIDGDGQETFDAAHVGTISVGALLNVIDWMAHGVSLMDTEATTIGELSDELQGSLVSHDLLSADQAERVGATMTKHHHHVTERKKENLARAQRDEEIHRFGCDVLVGAVDFLKKPISVFIRLSEPRTLGELTTEGHYPIKFIFLCLGPAGTCQAQLTSYHEAGRAFSCLMSNKGFLDIASEAPSNGILCEAVHTFMAESDIIPHFHHMFFAAEDQEEDQAEKHYDSDSDEEGSVPSTPLLLSTRHNEVWKLTRMPSPTKGSPQVSPIKGSPRSSPKKGSKTPTPTMTPTLGPAAAELDADGL